MLRDGHPACTSSPVALTDNAVLARPRLFSFGTNDLLRTAWFSWDAVGGRQKASAERSGLGVTGEVR